MLAKHKSLATPGQMAADKSRKLSSFKGSTYTGYRLITVLEKEEQRDKANKKTLASFCTGAEIPKIIWNVASYCRALLSFPPHPQPSSLRRLHTE